MQAVFAERVHGGGDDVETVRGNVMGGLVGMCGRVQVSLGVALGEWVADGEIGQEPCLAEEAPTFDVDLGAWGLCGCKFWDDLFTARLVAGALCSLEEDVAAAAVGGVQRSPSLASTRMQAVSVQKLRATSGGGRPWSCGRKFLAPEQGGRVSIAS